LRQSFSVGGRGSIEIYAGKWGHKRTEHDNFGCWSRLHLNRDGSFEYEAGYKWMRLLQVNLANEESLAKSLSFEYLGLVAGHLSGGDAIKKVARDVRTSAR
jgi:hypothetical protein